MGSLSPLWGIFLTQESNYGLLHHKRILYQLSHQGCPFGVCSCILCLLIFLFYQLTFFNEKINIAIIPYQQIGNKRKKCLQSHPPKEKLLAFWYFLLVFFFWASGFSFQLLQCTYMLLSPFSSQYYEHWPFYYKIFTSYLWRVLTLKNRCCCWIASVVSGSVWPQRRQPTRLPRPWDSPGKNTGVGCHFLLHPFFLLHIKSIFKSFVYRCSCSNTWDPNGHCSQDLARCMHLCHDNPYRII